MRQWRVGTLSMGLLLLFTGIMLIYAQFQSFQIADSFLKWWPVIFIILGCEVLLQTCIQKGEESRIKYDIFSIFIIFAIVITGLSLQVASEFGLSQYIQENITAQEFNLQTTQEIALDKDIEKVIVEGKGCCGLKVRTGAADSIICNARAGVRAQTEAEGQLILQENVRVNTCRNGNTLYLRLDLSRANNYYERSFSLVLPERLAVELEHRDASLELMMNQVKNDWLIKGDGSLNITLAPDSDIMVYALTENPLDLNGNLNWTTLDGQEIKAPVNDDDNNNNPTEEYQININGNQIVFDSRVSGITEGGIEIQAQIGQGSHKMTIIHQGHGITVNKLP